MNTDDPLVRALCCGLRRARGSKSRRWLAIEADTTETSILRAEACATGKAYAVAPSLALAARLAKALGLDLLELVDLGREAA
jgi:hypothetical protein